MKLYDISQEVFSCAAESGRSRRRTLPGVSDFR